MSLEISSQYESDSSRLKAKQSPSRPVFPCLPLYLPVSYLPHSYLTDTSEHSLELTSYTHSSRLLSRCWDGLVATKGYDFLPPCRRIQSCSVQQARPRKGRRGARREDEAEDTRRARNKCKREDVAEDADEVGTKRPKERAHKKMQGRGQTRAAKSKAKPNTKKDKRKCGHTTAEIRWWSPTQLLRSR